MKLKTFAVFLFTGYVLLFIPVAQGAENEIQKAPSETESPASETQSSPVASVPTELFEFESVAEGLDVSHNFVIQNTGNGPLKIENVKTG